MVRWWQEWKRYGVLPYGHVTLADELAFVFEAIDAAETAFDKVQAELERVPPGGPCG